jgi:hypothetical protein
LHRQQVRLTMVSSRRNFVVNVTATPLIQIHWVFFFLREASRCSFTADYRSSSSQLVHRDTMDVFTHSLTCSFIQPLSQLNVLERMAVIARFSKI